MALVVLTFVCSGALVEVVVVQDPHAVLVVRVEVDLSVSRHHQVVTMLVAVVVLVMVVGV
jgi:hypothetical protein